MSGAPVAESEAVIAAGSQSFAAAARLTDKGDTSGALRILAAATRAAPGYARAYYERGALLTRSSSLGLSDLLFQKFVGTARSVRGFQAAPVPFLSDLPFVGPVLFNHNLLVYGAYLIVPVAWFVLFKTTFGLNLRAVGENPAAADSLGVKVIRTRYLALMLGGIMAGAAGASLSIALLNVFQQNLTNGLGFIAVALVYFGGWRPFVVLAGSLVFSFVNALQVWVQVLGLPIPSDIAVMMPYVLTIVVLIVSGQRVRAPAALTVPFERGG